MTAASYVATSLAGVYAALAVVHVAWAAGIKTAATAAVPTRSDGQPVIRPGPAATVAVAVLLLVAAFVLLGDVEILPPLVPRMLYRIGTWGIGAVFLLRVIGDFRYIGMFKRERTSRFARLDTRVYTPLCALLAAGTLFVAAWR